MQPTKVSLRQRYVEEWQTHLAKFQAIINNVLKRSHLYLPDELRLDHRLSHDIGHQLVKMTKDDVRLVVRRRVESRHSMTTVLHLGIFQHRLEHINQVALEHVVKDLILIGESVAKGLDGNGPQQRRLVVE